MKKFDHIIIGFGKGGKTLAGNLASSGAKVALVERSDKMFGGTCINVGCIPTKSLEHSARISFNQAGNFEEKAVRYSEAIEEKRRLTNMLRQKNYDKAVLAGVEVILGQAAFIDENNIEVQLVNGGKEILQGNKIYLNTGASPYIPSIKGLKESNFVYTSETIMELDKLPAQLLIIGGGYIGLEFASYYANFGSQVTVIQDSSDFMVKEDQEIAEVIFKSLADRGISVLLNTKVELIKDESLDVIVKVKTEDSQQELKAQAVLIATGRRPNIAALNLAVAGIVTTERGAVKVDKYLRTSVPHIFALGDVTGGLQFTYISLDDSRIIKSQLTGDNLRTTENRGSIPYSVFLDPPFSRVGLTEAEAREQGYAVKIARLPAPAIPKAHVLNRPVGMLKVIIDAATDKILGAHLFCLGSHEMINLIKMTIDNNLTYHVLRDAIYTHPTMSESFNDLLALV